MVTSNGPDTDQLLEQARRGVTAARHDLLARHQKRLRQMVAVCMDRRLAARVDPSDVVQEALLDAAQELSDYLGKPPLPFYPWLRQLAWDRLIELHRRHIHASKRSVRREAGALDALDLPDESALELARRLVHSGSTPSKGLLREELRGRVRAALASLRPNDRELLVLRHLEQLSIRDIAAILKLTTGAVKVRQLRALERLRTLLIDDEDPP